jgi:hypothetical protein
MKKEICNFTEIQVLWSLVDTFSISACRIYNWVETTAALMVCIQEVTEILA